MSRNGLICISFLGGSEVGEAMLAFPAMRRRACAHESACRGTHSSEHMHLLVNCTLSIRTSSKLLTPRTRHFRI
jgi:hypothetical protein